MTASRLLTKLDYRNLLAGGTPIVATPNHEVALAYARELWPSLEIGKRILSKKDVVLCHKHGDVVLTHVRAYARKQPHVVLVLAETGGELSGHILVDLASDDAEPHLICPSVEHDGATSPEQLSEFLAKISSDEDDPFAILETGDGTYIQTLNTGDGFVLEYQLVSTACHYETPELVSLEEAVAALISFGWGNHEWLTDFAWQRQDLSGLLEES